MSYNHTALKSKNQALNKPLISGQVNASCALPEEISKDPFSYFKNLYPARRQVINGLIGLQAKYGPNFVATTKDLAAICGVHWATVDREIRALKSCNLLTVYTDIERRHMMNPWFYDPEVKRLLTPIFKSLALLSLLLLVSTPMRSYQPKFQREHRLSTQGVYGYIYINNYNSMGAIRDIENLSLTHSGRITLMAFHPEAIEHADRVLGWCTRVKNRFNFFVKVCWNWCNENGFKPLWGSTVMQRKTWNVSAGNPPENDKDTALRDVFSAWDDSQPWKEKLSRDIKSVALRPDVVIYPKASAQSRDTSKSIPRVYSPFSGHQRSAEQQAMLDRYYAERDQYDLEARQVNEMRKLRR